jgi:hypothetical protein
VHGEQGKHEDRWTRAILERADVAVHHGDSDGSVVLFRPHDCLVDLTLIDDPGHAGEAARSALAAAKGYPARDHEHARAAKQLGFAVWTIQDTERLPELVTALRTLQPGGATLNHVLVGDPHRFGGTGPAEPAPQPTDVPGSDPSAGAGLRVAVLDTGVDEALGLAAATPTDVEIPDEDSDGALDAPAGHGTFVAGIIRRYAPHAELLAYRVLRTPAGIASELEVAQALLALPEVDLINCSFGGPTLHDAAPVVLERALAKLSPHTVVVASAGNQGSRRPHYPAASKRVIGVASIEGGCGHEGWSLADYSNRGWWVDAAAPGTRIDSTFVAFDESPSRSFSHGAQWSGTSFAAPAVAGAMLAVASRFGIPVAEAAYRLIGDPERLRITDGGTIVVPEHAPKAD